MVEATLYRRIFLWVMLLNVFAASLFARTWQVEQDGSGEFATIHEAMIACSAGDTIMIGPGRYDDFHPLVAPAWTREVIVIVTKDELTFIGSGTEATIIGPTVMYDPPGLPAMAVASIVDTDAKFVNIGFDNAYDCIAWEQGRIEVVGCRFRGYNNGIVVLGQGGGSIVESDFYSEESIPTGIIVFGPAGPIDISGCTFGGPDVNELGIGINGSHNVTIRDCHFTSRGAMLFSGSSGSITGCTTTEVVGQALQVSSASQVDLTGNQFHGNYASLYVDSASRVTGTENIFTGGEQVATIYISSQSTVQLNNNHILKSGDLAVELQWFFNELVTQDLTTNFWGTTDTDSIAMWIKDVNDDPAIHSVVDYLPIANGPIPTEATTWGSVKSMFR